MFKTVVKLSQQLVPGCLFEFSCSFLSCGYYCHVNQTMSSVLCQAFSLRLWTRMFILFTSMTSKDTAIFLMRICLPFGFPLFVWLCYLVYLICKH